MTIAFEPKIAYSSNMALNLNRLNSRQQEAVLHSHGPLLILAGAGSGKTSTMAYRIAHLIAERRVSAHSILGLSFTNKAARELRERVTRLITKSAGPQAAKGLTVTTFHSLCVRILRAHARVLGFQPEFTILDENDQLDVLKQVLRQIRIDERKFDPKVILFEIGQAKNRFLGFEAAQNFFLESGRLNPEYALAAASSYERYQEKLRILNAVDFDDLIFYTVKLLSEDAGIREQYNRKFEHILVDEYQDTNPTQFQILQHLTQLQQNICVVGDDDQSIYAWRGADPTHILEFGSHYPAAKTIALEQNYRSTSRILDAANAVIGKNTKRYPKKLWSDRGEGELITEVVTEDDHAESDFVGEEILRRKNEFNRNWSDFAVLYRSNSQSRVFEESFRRRGIPYKIVGGLSFLDRKEVKDVLAYFRLIVNPAEDPSFRRIINWPARGIGKTSLDALGNHAFQQTKPIFEILDQAPGLVTPKAVKAVENFKQAIGTLTQELNALPPSAQEVSFWAKGVLDRLQIRRAVEEDCDDPVQAAKKMENIEELVHSLGQISFEGETLTTGADFMRNFLNRMTLQAQEDQEDQKEKEKRKNDEVTLLTLHGAKGLEYPIVFMVGVEDGFLPHKRTIEGAEDLGEERRLCYVGITRAKDFLFITRAKNRIRYGKPVPRNPSRFLDEIPKELLNKQNLSSTPDLSSPAAQEEHEAKVKNYLAEIRARIGQKK